MGLYITVSSLRNLQQLPLLQIEKLICIDLLSFGPMALNKHVRAARYIK